MKACRASHPITILILLLLAVPTFARSKNRSPGDQDSLQIQQLAATLKSNDVDAAETLATVIYQQATNTVALQPSDPTVIVDPTLVSQTVEFNRTKAAYDIAATFYRYAELDVAKQWAMTATTGGALSEQYVRRATVLLGNIASAMDRSDEAIDDFTSVINLPGQYQEQTEAYAGLLDLLMLQKQDDLVTQWVRHGQSQFAGGDLELVFLKRVGATLKRRNQPLWKELDQQIVDLSSSSPGNTLNALRRLASNARKFGRWAEAETNYAAICALSLGSAEDTVNSYLFLAESQAKQGRDFTPTLQVLQSNATAFAQSSDREYATYRTAKFYEEQGSLDAAATDYQTLVSSSSTSTWAAAALHQLGSLKEKQGDLQGALQLYLQYPQRFPQNKRLAVQSYASALNVATALGDTNSAAQLVGAIANSVAAIQDYNAQLNLAFYFQKRGKQQIAESYLESALPLARSALGLAPDLEARSLIHFRVLRRLFDFAQYQRMVDYFTANANDIESTASTIHDYQLQCRCYNTMALMSTGHRQQALDELHELLDQAQANRELEGKFIEILALYSDNAAAAELFEWAAQKYPTHQWVNIGRLQLAIQKFNSGDYPGAQKLADDVTNSLSENLRMEWIRKMYWSAVYLRGCCLQAQGDSSQGNVLKQSALTKEPHLNIQQDLSAK
jgi:outer membrane protein assembly factor BamD (BamD/ComL family)